MKRLSNLVRAFVKEEEGAAIAEYGLLLAIVAIGVITILVAFRDQLNRIWTEINADLQALPAAP